MVIDSGNLGAPHAGTYMTKQSANDAFYGFLETRQPNADYLPYSPKKRSGDSNECCYKDRQFMLRFDIITYAAACYPYPFCRLDVMQKLNINERKQQRILRALAADGYLQLHKGVKNNITGANYKLNPKKLEDLNRLLKTSDIKLRKRGPQISDRHSEYLPKASIIDKRDDTAVATSYSALTTSAEMRFSILTYAAAWYPNSFKRKEAMVNIDVNDRSQQRLLKSLVEDGFLEEEKNHPRVDYRLIPSSLERLQTLLDRADEREKNRLFK